jgi:hypothetical protein
MLDAMRNALGDVSQTKDIWVFLVQSRPPAERYSVLYVPDPALRWQATSGLLWYLGRPDLRIKYFLPRHTVPEYEGARSDLKKLRVDINEGKALLITD